MDPWRFGALCNASLMSDFCMRTQSFSDEADECRRRALKFQGRPEAAFLMKLASSFDALAQDDRGELRYPRSAKIDRGATLDSAARKPRKANRISLDAEVTLRRPGKSNYRVRAFDASPGGCKLEFIERPDLGEFLWVKFEGLELLEARVCWTEGFTAGVEFQKTLHPGVFEMVIKRLAAS
jgi:hypothetical protein